MSQSAAFLIRFPDNAMFNHCITMDLVLFLDDIPVLHTGDIGPNDSAASLIHTLDTRTI